MKIDIALLGANVLQTYLTKAGSRIVPEVAAALRESSLLAFRESQKIVPHADGPLRASGVVRPPEVSGKTVSVTMGYGGAASAYALRQHEDLSLNHPDPNNDNSDPAGRAKYLEDPVREAIPALRKNLNERLKKATKK